MTTAPHAFTLRQLQYVVAVADELSFHRAATRCGVSQPSLSSQLAQVEEALGVRIFERSQKRVLVTAIGREFIERARRLLADADELQRAAERASDPLSGSLRIGVIPTIAPYLLPSITSAVRKALPRMRLAWLEERTETLVRRLHEGVLDGAIVALESDLGAVEKHVIARDPFFLVTRPPDPLAQSNAPVTARELRGRELLLLEDGHCFREQALEVCAAAHANASEFRATSLLTLTQMIAGTGGATLLPAMALDTETRRARLHVRPLALSHAERTIGLVWRKGASTGQAMQSLGEAIEHAYPETPRKNLGGGARR